MEGDKSNFILIQNDVIHILKLLCDINGNIIDQGIGRFYLCRQRIFSIVVMLYAIKQILDMNRKLCDKFLIKGVQKIAFLHIVYNGMGDIYIPLFNEGGNVGAVNEGIIDHRGVIHNNQGKII